MWKGYKSKEYNYKFASVLYASSVNYRLQNHTDDSGCLTLGKST